MGMHASRGPGHNPTAGGGGFVLLASRRGHLPGAARDSSSGDPHGRCVWSLVRRRLAGRWVRCWCRWPAATTAPGKAAPPARTRCSPRCRRARRATWIRRRPTGRNDTTFTYQIYEPPYGYHYLKRPYQLIGKSAQDVAKPRYLRQGRQAAARRRAGRPGRRERLRRPASSPASCTSRTRRSPRTPTATTSTTTMKPGELARHATRRWSSSSRARASWSPTTSSTPSSATPRRASRRRSSASSPST